MGARLVIAFCDGNKPAAYIYDHWGGDNPKDARKTLKDFLDAVEAQCEGDTRFDNPQYLAAKYVVWRAARYAEPAAFGRLAESKEPQPLNFLSLGIMRNQNDIDMECLAHVHCKSAESATQNPPRPRIAFPKGKQP